MRYGIFADIHGNLEAFGAVLGEFKKQGIEQLICAGDIVGYGAEPNACIEKTKSLSISSVAGNHDWAVVGKSDINYFNSQAKEAILWTEKNLKEENKDFLKKLPLLIEKNDFLVVHGSLKEPAAWHYILNVRGAGEVFKLMKKNLLFIAHTHIPVVFSFFKGKIESGFNSRIKIKEGMKCIVNVGSIGQPRDGDPRAGYVIFDEERREVVYKRINYPVEKAQEKIRSAGLPEIEAARLSEGR